MKLNHILPPALACAAVLFLQPLVRADVKLPAMFTDHAVLQRDMPVPVWGWADPGEKVTVTIAGQTAPGDGICLANWRAGITSCTDVNMRFMRCRLGDASQQAMDGIGLGNSRIPLARMNRTGEAAFDRPAADAGLLGGGLDGGTRGEGQGE